MQIDAIQAAHSDAEHELREAEERHDEVLGAEARAVPEAHLRARSVVLELLLYECLLRAGRQCGGVMLSGAVMTFALSWGRGDVTVLSM